MNLYGYELETTSDQPLKLSESSVECSIDELEEIIDFLKSKHSELVSWAKTYDKSLPILPSDYAELQPLYPDDDSRLLFLVNLESVIKKHGQTQNGK